MKNKLLRITSVILTIVVLGLVISLSCISCFADTPQGVVNLFDETKIVNNARISVSGNSVISYGQAYLSNIIPIGNNDFIYVTADYLSYSWTDMRYAGLAIAITSTTSSDTQLSIGSNVNITNYWVLRQDGTFFEGLTEIDNNIFRIDVSDYHNLNIIITFFTGVEGIWCNPSSVIVNYDGVFSSEPENINILDMYRHQVLILPTVFSNLGYFQFDTLTIIGVILCIFVGLGILESIVNLILRAMRGD